MLSLHVVVCLLLLFVLVILISHQHFSFHILSPFFGLHKQSGPSSSSSLEITILPPMPTPVPAPVALRPTEHPFAAMAELDRCAERLQADAEVAVTVHATCPICGGAAVVTAPLDTFGPIEDGMENNNNNNFEYTCGCVELAGSYGLVTPELCAMVQQTVAQSGACGCQATVIEPPPEEEEPPPSGGGDDDDDDGNGQADGKGGRKMRPAAKTGKRLADLTVGGAANRASRGSGGGGVVVVGSGYRQLRFRGSSKE